MAAELKRVAGLNKLESAEKADAENPLSFVVQAYRYLKVRRYACHVAPYYCICVC